MKPGMITPSMLFKGFFKQFSRKRDIMGDLKRRFKSQHVGTYEPHITLFSELQYSSANDNCDRPDDPQADPYHAYGTYSDIQLDQRNVR